MVWRLEKEVWEGGRYYFSQGPEKARKGRLKKVKLENPAGICRKAAGTTVQRRCGWSIDFKGQEMGAGHGLEAMVRILVLFQGVQEAVGGF